MSHGLVSDDELSKVHSNHVGQDFDTVEHLSVVNTNHAADHFGHDDHVTEVSLDTAGSLAGDGLLLCLPQTGDQRLRLALQATGQTAASAGRVQANQLIDSQVQQGLELDATVLELLEGALLLQGGGLVLLSLIDVVVSVFFISHCNLTKATMSVREYQPKKLYCKATSDL